MNNLMAEFKARNYVHCPECGAKLRRCTKCDGFGGISGYFLETLTWMETVSKRRTVACPNCRWSGKECPKGHSL